MKSKPETLQNRFIKETFAKNRMSKALSVQKKIGHGRTDGQTDTQIFLLIICRLGLTPVDHASLCTTPIKVYPLSI